MGLMFVVYLVDLLDTIKIASGVLLGCLIALGGFSLLGFLDKCGEEREMYTAHWKKNCLWLKTATLMFVLLVFIPSTNTIKYMGAAYLVQTTYESEFVQEAGSLAGKAVINQLKTWSKANPDINTLLESIGQTKSNVKTIKK